MLFVALESAYDELVFTVLVVKFPLFKAFKKLFTTTFTLYQRKLPMKALQPAVFEIIGLETRTLNGASKY